MARQSKNTNTRKGKNMAGYDAVSSNTRRRAVRVDLRHEDKVLRPRERDVLVSATRELRRNAAIVGWAIRKHQDYVSTFSFQCRTSNRAKSDAEREVFAALDDRVEELVEWWSRPFNCDVSGRFSLQQLIRMAEGLRTTDGDCFVLKLSDGRVQIIEGDRVRTPTDLGEFAGTYNPDALSHGIEVTAANKAIRYAVNEYTDTGGFRLKYLVEDKYLYHHGYFDRYEQVRGVSQLASAINTFCDLYEAQEYALAKMKLAQLFALKFTRAAATETSDDAEPYAFNFGGGPQAIDLDPGDNADFLESKTPSTEFQSFMQTGISIGLKALDIPFSFFAEDYTNYSGARQALMQYEQSASQKRQANKQLLTNLTLWRLQMFIADGTLVLPDGFTLSDIDFEWIPAALPWIDPLKEAQAFGALIDKKLMSRQQVAKQRGEDWFTTADQLAEEQAYAAKLGLPADGTTPQPTVDAEEIAAAVAAQRNSEN